MPEQAARLRHVAFMVVSLTGWIGGTISTATARDHRVTSSAERQCSHIHLPRVKVIEQEQGGITVVVWSGATVFAP